MGWLDEFHGLPKEFDDAWENVDVFQPDALAAIVNVRANFGILSNERTALEAKVWSNKWPRNPPEEIATAIAAVEGLESNLPKLIQLLNADY